jgi:3-isopropylmalate/(R)-2-methylmalate dehydratase small subunit
LPDTAVEALAKWVEADPAKNQITIDLPNQTVSGPPGSVHKFDIGAADKEMLLEGLDPIGLTLKREPEIAAFEAKDRARRPWVYIAPQ